MRITHLASEIAPIARIGGLGDVLYGLSRALTQKNHAVSVILPKYDTASLHDIQDLTKVNSFQIPGEKMLDITVWEGKIGSIQVILLDVDTYFQRQMIYGCPDDPLRFALFCKSAVHYLSSVHVPCDILHLHDWQAALAAPLFRQLCFDAKVPIVFTIHNLTYQGICTQDVLTQSGLNFSTQEILKDPTQADCYNLLKAGILFSDYVTTVSPRYAEEILTTEEGGALKPFLVKIQKNFSGIINGIDCDFWNPETDVYLPEHYSVKDLKGHKHPFITAKELIKKTLRKRFFMSDENRPLITCVTRLVWQKGTELICDAIEKIPQMGGQFILLGTLNDPEIGKQFLQLQKEFQKHPHIHLELSFDEKLSHLLFAGADILLVPSRFEPCGLTQLIAMRYGTVPLVRASGGLANTVFEEVNGFTFHDYSISAFELALKKSLDCWQYTPIIWRKLVETGMTCDYSWDKPVDDYIKIYNILNNRNYLSFTFN